MTTYDVGPGGSIKISLANLDLNFGVWKKHKIWEIERTFNLI